MYKWRQMTDDQREETLRMRQENCRPWHSPPHFGEERNVYLLTSACYEHKPLMATPTRRDEWSRDLLDVLSKVEADIRAWVILPNHWHVLLTVTLPMLRPMIGRLNNGKATQWNREDKTPGRKVWHGFSDRYIRNERHYYASLNYVHANPVKHGYVANATDWKWSSLHTYIDEVGRDTLKEWWKEYPVSEYGKGWDD